jgi:hypothetical protein
MILFEYDNAPIKLKVKTSQQKHATSRRNYSPQIMLTNYVAVLIALNCSVIKCFNIKNCKPFTVRECELDQVCILKSFYNYSSTLFWSTSRSHTGRIKDSDHIFTRENQDLVIVSVTEMDSREYYELNADYSDAATATLVCVKVIPEKNRYPSDQSLNAGDSEIEWAEWSSCSCKSTHAEQGYQFRFSKTNTSNK